MLFATYTIERSASPRGATAAQPGEAPFSGVPWNYRPEDAIGKGETKPSGIARQFFRRRAQCRAAGGHTTDRHNVSARTRTREVRYFANIARQICRRIRFAAASPALTTIRGEIRPRTCDDGLSFLPRCRRQGLDVIHDSIHAADQGLVGCRLAKIDSGSSVQLMRVIGAARLEQGNEALSCRCCARPL